MRKNKLFLLLALLLTAATGAWATDDTYTVKFEANGKSKTIENVTLPKTWACNYNSENGELDQIIKELYELKMGYSSNTNPNTSVTGGNGKVTVVSSSDQSITITEPFEGTATVTGQYVNYENYNYHTFTYSLTISIPGYTASSASSGYTVSLKDGVKDADKWTVKVGDGQAQALPIGGLKGDGSETVTLQYNGRMKVKGVKATSEAVAPAAGKTVDLSSLSGDYEAQDGDVLTGTTSYKVTIAAGATVTLKDVTVNNQIACSGDATIILADGSTNTVTASENAGIQIGGTGTLTINAETAGDGKLTVQGGDGAAGIGTSVNGTGGNIVINGGTVNATAGFGAAGIGAGYGNGTSSSNECGDITINGGTVIATGGFGAAGIGTGAADGSTNKCGTITIGTGVTSVTATMGVLSSYSIGIGGNNTGTQTCGTITIGGTKYWENNAAVNGGDSYLAQSPLIYDPTAAAKEPATVTTAPTGAAIVGVGKTTALVSGGVAEGGTMMYKVTTTNTKPASTDGFSDAVPTAQSITASGKVYVWYYVKGDGTHSDSEIAATAIEVPVADVVWDATNVTDIMVYGPGEYEKEGIKLSCNAEDVQARWRVKGDQSGIEFATDEYGGYTFTAPAGKAFTKIEMKAQGPEGWNIVNIGTGWTLIDDYMICNITWTGSAASTVDLLKDSNGFDGKPLIYIAFYLSE